MGTIDTSTATTATGYSNQRKIDRCQNGVLWMTFWNGTSTTTASMEYWYSTDNGATWTENATKTGFTGTGTTNIPNSSFFIDLDDYAHIVYKDRADGQIYYRRGTPNAGRTEYTFTSALLTGASTSRDYPDVVAHRGGVSTTLLTDAFATADAAKWTYGSGVTAAGNLNIPAAPSYAGVTSVTTFDFHETTFSVNLITVPTAATGVQAIMRVELDSNNQLEFVYENGQLIARIKVAGVIDYSAEPQVTYNGTNHAFLQFRETNGRIYWQYGTDGITWTTLHSIATPFSFNAIKCVMLAGNYVGHGGPGAAVWDNANVITDSGWTAHVTTSYLNGTTNRAYHIPITITSAHVITAGTSLVIATYSVAVHMYPSIDFNHTGDGKTVAGGTPHLYVAYSMGATGGAAGIRFTKATYTAGPTWTFGTARVIDTTRYMYDHTTMANCLFDGTRVIIAGLVYDASNTDLMLYERDAADTTTTTTQLIGNTIGSDQLLYGSISYDSVGNIYLFGNGAGSLNYRKWTRATTILGSIVVIDSAVTDMYVSTRRGYIGNRIDYIYRDYAASSPYNIVHGSVNLPIIDTSIAITATAYSNQRKIDRCQNGVLWATFWNGNSSTTDAMEFWYSTDSGVSWTEDTAGKLGFAGTGTTYVPDSSLFIDLDDYAHFVYKDRSNGNLYYRRGTSNAGRTAWTWSAVTTIFLSTSVGFADVIAHREGTGWKAHLTVSTTGNYALTYVISITSGGVITVGPQITLGNGYGGGHTYPSIDFNHTGDGKTVAGSTPHLYAVWSAGVTGAGNGIRFKKATYSAGVWTWGTEREIDNTRYINSISSRYIVCMFDGTRVVITGQLQSSTATTDQIIYERDIADTTTTTIVLLNSATSTQALNYGSATYDSSGNIYLFGDDGVNAGGSIIASYRKWTRATTTYEVAVTVQTTAEASYFSIRRGSVSNRIDYIYRDYAPVSPYSIISGSITLPPSTVDKTFAFLWDVKSSVDKTFAFVWDVKSSVDMTFQFVWDVIQLLTVDMTFAFTWNVIGSVDKTFAFVWNVNGTVDKTFAFVWNVNGRVDKTFTFLWDTSATPGVWRPVPYLPVGAFTESIAPSSVWAEI